MNIDDILASARERTKLPDPDSDSWREGLSLLLRDHAEADLLSERGHAILQERYIKALAARMHVDAYLRQHSAPLSARVVRPVFILGMPRTGTTMVSYLMDADPATRSLLKWEAYELTPPAAPGALRSDPRCLAELARDRQILESNAGGFATHFEAGDGPTECVHLLAQDFKSLMLAVLSSTPRYHEWLMSCDMTSAFEHRRRALQILQSTNPGRWVLKMPSDSLFIRTLFEVFPDAKVIWTHRDPYASLASSMSMRAQSRPLFNKDVDLAYMREYFPRQLAMHLTRPLAFSQERPEDVFHLYYDELLKDPLAQLERIYGWLGDAWTPEAEAGMRSWLRENPQGRFGRHQYSLAQWGFTEEDLTPYFSDYLRAHPVAA
ncbi:MAG: sulfotransferase [Polyangiales bacterium]